MIFKGYRFFILIIFCLLVVSYISKDTTEPILKKTFHKNLEISLIEETEGTITKTIGKRDKELNYSYIKGEEKITISSENIIKEKASIDRKSVV